MWASRFAPNVLSIQYHQELTRDIGLTGAPGNIHSSVAMS